MEVSHFELVYKLQSPEGDADTVLQGYFLEISNLEDKNILYQLEFVTSSISDPNRDLFNNTFIFVDTPGTNNNDGAFALSGNAESKSYRLNRFVDVPAHGTALVAVLPSDPFTMSGLPDPMDPATQFECRGYVNITVPALFEIDFSGPFPIIRLVPQSDEPVKTMLTPQNRAQYLGADGAISAQTQSSVPVAGGGALNLIEASQGFFPLFPAEFDLAASMKATATDEPDPLMLATMLAKSHAAGMDLGKFNKALKKSGVGLAIETRKM